MSEKKLQKKSPKNKQKKEQLSRKDIEELMGINKPVYTRHNGAIRRK
ncbi:hypothetical protein [Bacillus sp. UNC438CL73TsuS30]|nr:hypothetical protein [Bacillus sp. UNC438CL73TsuS30]